MKKLIYFFFLALLVGCGKSVLVPEASAPDYIERAVKISGETTPEEFSAAKKRLLQLPFEEQEILSKEIERIRSIFSYASRDIFLYEEDVAYAMDHLKKIGYVSTPEEEESAEKIVRAVAADEHFSYANVRYAVVVHGYFMRGELREKYY
ncbi:MAG: hypothetical protein HGB03_03850 [Candidatus Yonathbacteria bacterium]|nr:hypothetical protein [Candidatus Yonathbacteria bacterium]NTW47635.1 hypothetical protein [Candidatus Yonathbacteria bacterium]